MRTLTTKQMSSMSGGAVVNQEACENTAALRYTLTGICTVGSAFGVVGLLIFGPCALGLYIIDGVCQFGPQE